ncbi:MAG: hypothetical protein AB8D52_00230 [Gammaproteobacteria bacterium]
MDKKYRLFIFSIFLSFPVLSTATLFDDIAYTQLQTEPGILIPDGADVSVGIVEAFTGNGCNIDTSPASCTYRPDTAIKNYRNDDTTPAPPLGYDHSSSLGASTSFSSHASGSAQRFYGLAQSTAPGVSEVHVFAADHWLGNGYLNSGTINNPQTSNIRVSNHSYQGSVSSDDFPEAIDILSRIDWSVEQDEQNIVTASTTVPINGTAFNVIAVGRTDAGGPPTAVNLGGSIYNSTLRARPDIVVPETTHSAATPRVASAAALLVGYGHDQALGIAETINGKTIYNAERSEVIKSVLMAGASRTTSNTDGRPDINNFRSASNQTDNGLDSRFGAGQLNINNSYQILAAGEQEAGAVSTTGFDYVESFGGENSSNTTTSYEFTFSNDMAWFAASLVWNLAFETDDSSMGDEFSDFTASLYDLNLALYFINPGLADTLVASSNSLIDNTENIWVFLDQMGDYRIDVTAPGAAFDHDYAVSWQTSAVPIPGAAWLFASALLVLITRRKQVS